MRLCLYREDVYQHALSSVEPFNRLQDGLRPIADPFRALVARLRRS